MRILSKRVISLFVAMLLVAMLPVAALAEAAAYDDLGIVFFNAEVEGADAIGTLDSALVLAGLPVEQVMEIKTAMPEGAVSYSLLDWSDAESAYVLNGVSEADAATGTVIDFNLRKGITTAIAAPVFTTNAAPVADVVAPAEDVVAVDAAAAAATETPAEDAAAAAATEAPAEDAAAAAATEAPAEDAAAAAATEAPAEDAAAAAATEAPAEDAATDATEAPAEDAAAAATEAPAEDAAAAATEAPAEDVVEATEAPTAAPAEAGSNNTVVYIIIGIVLLAAAVGLYFWSVKGKKNGSDSKSDK